MSEPIESYQEILERLAKAVRDYADSGPAQFINAKLAQFAMEGDVDATKEIALSVARAVANGGGLDASQSYWIWALMVKLQVPSFALVAAQPLQKKMGAPRKPSKQAATCLLVFKAIFEVRAYSIEGAWEIVSEQTNQSLSNVKQAWKSKKSFVIEMLERSPQVEDGAAFLNEMLAGNRKVLQPGSGRAGKSRHS